MYGYFAIIFADIIRDDGISSFIERFKDDEEFYIIIGFLAIGHLTLNFVFPTKSKSTEDDE